MNEVIRLPIRDQIFAIEQMSLAKLPQIKIPIRHYFLHGIYAREGIIPPDTLLTGVIHKYENISIISKGTIRVNVDDQICEVSAPATIVAKPGIKRIGYTVTETVWTTITHAWLTDTEKKELRNGTLLPSLYAFSVEEFEKFIKEQNQWLELSPQQQQQ